MNKNISNQILNELRAIIKNPKCELEFRDNFELLICVILSAQTTDKKVNIVTKQLFKEYPLPKMLSEANISRVEEILKPLGLFRNKAKNIINTSRVLCDKYNGIVPGDFYSLTTLPGVGRKTANVVLALGFNVDAFPVDTHVYRVALRLGYISNSQSIEMAEECLKKYIPKDEWIESHHLFLLFGRYYCKKIKPACNSCNLKMFCIKK